MVGVCGGFFWGGGGLNHLEKLMCSNPPTQNAGTPAS